jgi:FtsH-binding integral membrane protein
MKTYRWIFWATLGVTLALCISLFCFNKLAKKVPLNYITLFVFTVMSSYLLAAICIFQDPQNVMIAAALTMAVFLSLTTLTFFVRYLITKFYNMLRQKLS